MFHVTITFSKVGKSVVSHCQLPSMRVKGLVQTYLYALTNKPIRLSDGDSKLEFPIRLTNKAECGLACESFLVEHPCYKIMYHTDYCHICDPHVHSVGFPEEVPYITVCTSRYGRSEAMEPNAQSHRKALNCLAVAVTARRHGRHNRENHGCS